MSYNLKHNTDRNRFEVIIDNQTAFVDYIQKDGTINFTHTEVPQELSGKGVGSFLAKGVLEYAVNHNLEVKPSCSFIKIYIDRHEEYQSISKSHSE